MKIDLKLAGSAAAEVEFTALRDALIAAQAATPTARAARDQAIHADPPGAAPFGGAAEAGAPAAGALHRFTARVPGTGEDA